MELFGYSGVHALVDGQFGSTGKGLFASYLASQAYKQGLEFEGTISNAGPNSGHTFYHGEEKHVLKQLPTFAVKTALITERRQYAFLSAGAIIDPYILRTEAEKYPLVDISVHPNAAVIDDAAKAAELGGSIAAVAGTRSGTGAAVARKVFREEGAIWGINGHRRFNMPSNVTTDRTEYIRMDRGGRFFLEVSQGFSLGLNSEFYPKVTSRECTVMQGIADARIAPRWLERTYMVIRTYPIRVGDVDGFSSGNFYADQKELEWSDIGVEPERTTVTNRIRRVFSFSKEQYIQALRANHPDFVLCNFMNYVKADQQGAFVRSLRNAEMEARVIPQVFYGWGPKDADITPF